MGTDNLFHKRKAKKAEELGRSNAKRAPYERVLIVCEGEKTEPYYFNGLIEHYGLSSANVEVTGDCGSDPLSIVRHAKDRYEDERRARNPFDRVYCVFDKDAHANYQRALTELSKPAMSKHFHAIASVPCFEYWLLLHFIYSTKPYTPLAGNSAGNQVLTELQNYFPEYQKASPDIFGQLVGQLEFAKKNAARALSATEQNHTDNPLTYVHELVAYLQDIKNKLK